MNTPATKFFLCLCLAFSFNTTAQNTSNALSYTGKMDNHKILLAAVNATELGSLLQKSGPFTIFAPSDAAFEKFSSNKIAELIKAEDKRALKSLLSYHIVAGQLTASRMLRAIGRGNGMASFTTVQGKKLIAHLDGYDIVVLAAIRAEEAVCARPFVDVARNVDLRLRDGALLVAVSYTHLTLPTILRV